MKKRFAFFFLAIAVMNTVPCAGITGDGGFSRGFSNPVLTGFHPDPSVCRVGDDFYLVTSTFQYFPGLALYRSRDLVNWTPAGHCITRDEQADLSRATSRSGIYAPVIRYNDGTFYVITTNVSGGGNFILKTTDPEGEWSDPIPVGVPGIDPSLYFEDGRCYLTYTYSDMIHLCEIDPDTGTILSEPVRIWGGTGGRYPEGPHIYRKDGWYYLLISEGGTEYGHMITIARSRTIDGPYSANTANPILTHVFQPTQTSPVQGTGHGDFVQAPDGSWWMIFLAFRTLPGQQHHILGRETFLAPVRWDEDAWPVVNGNGQVSLHMDCPALPQYPGPKQKTTADFSSGRPGPEWMFLRNPVEENYSFSCKSVRMKASSSSIDDMSVSPAFLARRQESMDFVASVDLARLLGKGAEAGITIYMDVASHYDVFVRRGPDGRMYAGLRYRLGELEHVETAGLVRGQVTLRVEGSSERYSFSYSCDGKDFLPLGRMNARYLSSETAGGFTGVVIGMYCTGDKSAEAEFCRFRYEDNQGEENL